MLRTQSPAMANTSSDQFRIVVITPPGRVNSPGGSPGAFSVFTVFELDSRAWEAARGNQIMKMLFSSMDLSEVTSVKNLLSRAGIPCDILNDAMSPSMLEMALYPELWIENDDDFLAASVLLASWRRDMPPIFNTPEAPAGVASRLQI